MENSILGLKIRIQGIVQGVGFRPFVFNLANKLSLTGWVKNNSTGVEIEINGKKNSLTAFTECVKSEAPPLAKIDNMTVESLPANGYTIFEILGSTSTEGEFVPVAPDIGVCVDCLEEFYNPKDRRHFYPFINCTNCGPRFTIIKDIPYDRPLTTMAPFQMCPDCAEEYNNPSNRRFHAQPTACPDCGPHIWVEGEAASTANTEEISTVEAIKLIQKELRQGKIVAIKGLGGFHLACDALNPNAVQLLRLRKKRDEKPFALMMPDIETIRAHCFITEIEERILISSEKPILILRKRPDSKVVPEIAPGQDTVGVMLPYTPLHHLLFQDFQDEDSILPCQAIVMTSGNLRDEPITFTNSEAKKRLTGIADVFLMHNRDIYTKCDDSVIRTVYPPHSQTTPLTEAPVFIRRARGYTPVPLQLPWSSEQVLAVGAELKSTVCLTRNQYAFTSQYLGDLQNYETYVSFEKTIQHFEQLYRINPEVLACDLHPDYLSTHYANDRSLNSGKPIFRIQHHHAHIASAMVENGIQQEKPVIGIAYDGTGYGDDGCIWGAEILVATYASYSRAYHLDYFPLPGGDLAIKHPSRTALALLWKEKIDWYPELECTSQYCAEDLYKIRNQLEHKINTPMTSSMGRLFDAVASLVNVRQKVNYEAQAAIELEAICDPHEKTVYPYELSDNRIIITTMLRTIVDEVLEGVPASTISARFHNTIVNLTVQIIDEIASETKINTVALSGGVWQNMRLLGEMIRMLHERKYNILFQQVFPSNDGGVSVGQAAIAHQLYKNGTF